MTRAQAKHYQNIEQSKQGYVKEEYFSWAFSEAMPNSTHYYKVICWQHSGKQLLSR